MIYYVLWWYSKPSKSTVHRELDPSLEFNEWFSSYPLDFQSYNIWTVLMRQFQSVKQRNTA